MFRYDPVRIFRTEGCADRKRAVGEALLKLAVHLMTLGNRFVSGTFYTGHRYSESDRLYGIFYEFAWYWTDLARKYLPEDSRPDEIEAAVAGRLTSDYDPVKANELPGVFERLPWYCFRPSHNYAEFVPLDTATLGGTGFLNQASIPLYREGKIEITIANHQAENEEELRNLLTTRLIRAVNVCRPGMLESVVRLLEEEAMHFVTVVNLAGDRLPGNRLTVNILEPPSEPGDIDTYLALLRRAGGRPPWSDGRGAGDDAT
jgi:hypothetical protein